MRGFTCCGDQLPLQTACNEEAGFYAQSSYLFAKRRDLSVPLCPEQDAEDPADSQPLLRGAPSGVAIVEKREVSAMFQSKGESLGFAGVESDCNLSRYGSLEWSDSQPAVAERRIEQIFRRGMLKLIQFPSDSRRNQHRAELVLQKREPADDGEVGDRGGVTDHHHR